MEVKSINDFTIEELMDAMINSPYRFDESFHEMDVFGKREYIREKYKKLDKYIFQNKSCYVNPYIVPWDSVLNENERNLFGCFRCSGLPMYPQYPVGKYWVDFGNPYYKVAIEADGKAFHDIEKDKVRDLELKKLGWKVYHISGSLSFSQRSVDTSSLNEYDEDYYEKWTEYLTLTLEGVLNCIGRAITGYHYFIPDEFEHIVGDVTRKHLLI